MARLSSVVTSPSISGTKPIQELFDILRLNNYQDIQYIPSRKSFFGIFKELENLTNIFGREKHLTFYYSFFPELYLWWISRKNKQVKFFYHFCFLNEPADRTEIVLHFGENWFSDALEQSVVKGCSGKYYLVFSVLPVGKYLVLRDSHESYIYHEYDTGKPDNRVYVGADSIKFVQFNQRYLRGSHYNKVLELGCGTGIQLVCVESMANHLTGVDINPRAVEFTALTAKLNDLEDRLTALQSDLFENIKDRYDLILANPWFLDLEKAGLEEIPDIIEKLDNFIAPGGTFAMYFGSYVKDNVDQGRTVMIRFAQDKGYEATFYRLGKTIEPHFLNRYKEMNISFINSYYAILRKNGSSRMHVIEPSLMRRIRDEIYLPLQRLMVKL